MDDLFYGRMKPGFVVFFIKKSKVNIMVYLQLLKGAFVVGRIGVNRYLL